jgi:hypothetical protein
MPSGPHPPDHRGEGEHAERREPPARDRDDVEDAEQGLRKKLPGVSSSRRDPCAAGDHQAPAEEHRRDRRRGGWMTTIVTPTAAVTTPMTMLQPARFEISAPSIS